MMLFFVCRVAAFILFCASAVDYCCGAALVGSTFTMNFDKEYFIAELYMERRPDPLAMECKSYVGTTLTGSDAKSTNSDYNHLFNIMAFADKIVCAVVNSTATASVNLLRRNSAFSWWLKYFFIGKGVL